MTVSVRMDPLLEKELELAARRKGVTKSQFIIEAVERALGRRDPYELLVALKAEEASAEYRVDRAPDVPEPESREQAYETEASRAALVARLRAKHGGSAG